MPREPTAGRFSHTNGVGRDRESGKEDIDDILQSAVIHIGRSQPPVEPGDRRHRRTFAKGRTTCFAMSTNAAADEHCVLVTSASGRVPNNASN
jgi:hypothetical protein